MMMITFITINSGLVPLIEGLSAQILYFRFEIIGVLSSHLLLFLFGRKNMSEKKAVSPRSHPASWHIHTHLYFVHIYEYMHVEILSIWIRRALQVSHPDSWAHIRVPHLCSVCVCVRIHLHTPTYTPTRVKNREDTDNTLIFLSVTNNFPRQATSAFIHELNPPILVPQR